MADQGDLARALRFAVSQIQPGNETPAQPMSAPDREWLDKVLGQVADPSSGDGKQAPKCRAIPTVLQSFVELLSIEEKIVQMTDAVKNELVHISEEAELIDLADDCERKNAVAPLSKLFTFSLEKCPSMMTPLCSILAELSQNSPACQEEAMSLIPNLLGVIRNDEFKTAKTKAVYALSAILRGNPSTSLNSVLFARGADDVGVIEELIELIAQENESLQLRTKAAFLLSCLVDEHEVRQYLNRGQHETVLRNINEEDANIKELIDGILRRITTHKNENINQVPLALAM